MLRPTGSLPAAHPPDGTREYAETRCGQNEDRTPDRCTTPDRSATVGAMPLPDSLTPYETLRGIEATLTFTATQLDELIGTQPDTALEGMLLSALAAVTGARASLADVRLNWDDLCSPEDKQHPQVLAEALQQAEEARVASLAGLKKLDEEVELALVEIDAGEVGIARRRLIAARNDRGRVAHA